MSGNKGSPHVQKLVFLGLALGQAIDKGRKSDTALERAKAIFDAGDELLGLLSFDRDEAKAEWDDWSPEDQAELVAASAEHFELGDKVLELKIEESIDIAFDFLALCERSVQLWAGEKG